MKDELSTIMPRGMRNRVDAIASDVWNMVFTAIDCEPEFTGPDAGLVAQATRDAFVKAMVDLLR